MQKYKKTLYLQYFSIKTIIFLVVCIVFIIFVFKISIPVKDDSKENTLLLAKRRALSEEDTQMHGNMAEDAS